MFHPKYTGVAFILNKPEYIGVVDFACTGFLAPGVVTYLKVGDLIPARFNIWDEVSLLNLLVVDVEKYFTRW